MVLAAKQWCAPTYFRSPLGIIFRRHLNQPILSFHRDNWVGLTHSILGMLLRLRRELRDERTSASRNHCLLHSSSNVASDLITVQSATDDVVFVGN
jgi:hypothetical protein